MMRLANTGGRKCKKLTVFSIAKYFYLVAL